MFLKVRNSKILVVFDFSKVDILFIFLSYWFLKVDTILYFLVDEPYYAFFSQT